MRRIFQFIFIVSTFICGIAYAQDVSAYLKPGYGTVEDVFTLSISVSGKSSNQASPPVFEPSPDFTLQPLGTTTSTQFVNGVQSFQLSFTYRVIPSSKLKPGTYQLPKGTIEVNGQQRRFENIKITILFSNDKDKETEVSGRTGPIDLVQIVDNLKPFVGEQIVYRAELASTLPVAKAKLSDIQLDNFLRESFGKQSQERQRRIGNTVVFTLAEPLFPTAPGKVIIPKREVTADLRAIRRIPGMGNLEMLDDFFADLDPLIGGATTKRRTSAKPIELEVRPLPPAPTDAKQSYFPVGTLKVTSSISKTSLKQGESAKLTIDVVSDGNLKPFDLDLGSLEGDDFSAFVDTPKLEQINNAGEKLISRKTFSVNLVTKQAGSIRVPPVKFYYFDPKSERYQSVQSDEYKLIVLPTPGMPKTPVKTPNVDQPKPTPDAEQPKTPSATVSPMLRDNGVSSNLFWILLAAGPAIVLLRLALGISVNRVKATPTARQELSHLISAIKHNPNNNSSDLKDAAKIIRAHSADLGLSSADATLLTEKIERIVYAPAKDPTEIKSVVKELERLN